MFTPELIRRYYALTPIFFWPLLWLEIRAMDRYLDALVRETGEAIDFGLALSPYGTLHITYMSDSATGYTDPDAWRPNYNAILNTLEPSLHHIYAHLKEQGAQALVSRGQRQECLIRTLRHTQRTQALSTAALYLDPG